MWTLDEIRDLNPVLSDQSTSFLDHVLSISAATDDILCATSRELEELGSPHIAAFAQLPFAIGSSDLYLEIPGTHSAISVRLKLSAARIALDVFGRIVSYGPQARADSDLEIAEFTQIVALIRLWGPRESLHRSYVECITPGGFRDDVIGRIERWMDLPEAGLAEPLRRHAPLSAQRFQGEVARRIRGEVQYALNSLLSAFGIANLQQLPKIYRLHGFFAMTAPGRLASADAPIPIAAALCAAGSRRYPSFVSIDKVAAALHRSTTLGERVVGQLMAMHRLLMDGEPELALVGCVSVIEWFLNELLPNVLFRNRSGELRSASISRILKTSLLNFLPKEQQQTLLELSSFRNSLVHGEPPHRLILDASSPRRMVLVDEHYVRSSLFFTLELYRAINLNMKAA